MKEYNLADAEKALKSAFLPLNCTVKEFNYGNSIVFEVTDNNGHLLLEEEHMAGEICSPDRDAGFPAIVEMARERLAERGYPLPAKKKYF
jgi:hypothetical protein